MSKIMSWEEYIKSNISHFRSFNDANLSSEAEEILATQKEPFTASFFQPSQVVVLDFGEDYPKCFIIVHSSENRDMEIAVLENLALKNFTSQTLKIQLLRPLLPKELSGIVKSVLQMVKPRADIGWISAWEEMDQSFLIVYKDDPRKSEDTFNILSEDLTQWTNRKIENYVRDRQREKIEETVFDLKRDAEAIPKEFDRRDKMIETTTRLEDQIKQLNKKVDEEVGGVRKLIGTTKEFQDFKIFTSDVDDLKRTHVPREVFDSEVKRLDQKIDSMKEIKFWSKRTIVDIALAIMAIAATIVAALFAAHVI